MKKYKPVYRQKLQGELLESVPSAIKSALSLQACQAYAGVHCRIADQKWYEKPLD